MASLALASVLYGRSKQHQVIHETTTILDHPITGALIRVNKLDDL
jgi:hypothetical protein